MPVTRTPAAAPSPGTDPRQLFLVCSLFGAWVVEIIETGQENDSLRLLLTHGKEITCLLDGQSSPDS